MLWTRVRTSAGYRFLSVVTTALLVSALVSPGAAVFADETAPTSDPAPVVAPEPVEVPAEVPLPVEEAPLEEAPEPVPDEVADTVEGDVLAEELVAEEAPLAEEAPVVESEVVEPSIETVSPTVIVAPALTAAVVDPPAGPRDDFPDPITVGEGCELTTIAIFWAGQNFEAGTVSVSNDGENLYVTFATSGGWTMSLTHLYVGTTPPASYAPGTFPYQTAHDPAVTSYTYTIALSDIPAEPGDTIYIAAHAEVSNGEQDETAWAGVGQWPGLLFTHIIQECEPEPVELTVVKFNDLDGDGEMDEGEPVVPGVEITLSVGETTLSEFTDENGEAFFGELAEGGYSIDEVLPEGWFPTVELPIEILLAAGQPVTIYIGNAQEEDTEPEPELPDLEILKSASVVTAAPGDVITYILTYRNIGEGDAVDSVITDDFDERYVTVVNAAGGTVVDGTIVWNIPGPLSAADGDQTIVYTVRVIDDMPAGTTAVDNIVVIENEDDSNDLNNSDDERVNVENPFLPFTPRLTETPEPEDDEEPFLPFTGGEALLVMMLATIAAAGGLGLRLAARRA
jgi:uncharacterized repeat protein (TIGR01451 family)